MNAEERTLIAGLFDRLRGVETSYRDPDADAFINDQVSRQPHAPYAMAQTLIVQNQSLEAALARIAELERQLEDRQDDRRDDRQSGGRDFLPAGPNPWGPRANAAMGAPAGFGGGQQGQYGDRVVTPYNQDAGRDQPYAPSSYGAPVGQPQQPQRGGGFLSGALTTAAGVAGGALLFSGIQSMFGGHEANAAAPDAAKAAEPQPDVASAPEAGGADGGWFSGLLGGSDNNDAGAADSGPSDGGDDWI